MHKYRVGDVVYVNFPLQEDPSQVIDRPALVLATLTQSGRPYYRLAKITKHNKSDRFVGKWITKDSKVGKTMRLDFDSFVDLENITTVGEFGIRRLKGTCTVVADIIRMCQENSINI